MIAASEFRFTHPWWLLTCLVVIPLVWMAWRNLQALGRPRQIAAVICRVLVVLLMAALLAGPVRNQTHEQVTSLVVLDKSQSIPAEYQDQVKAYLEKAMAGQDPQDRLGAVHVAQQAGIAKMPSGDKLLLTRSLALSREQSDLAAGVQLAMAIAPPDTAARIVVVSDGNETMGDLSEAARIAVANKIPIDVLPIQYSYRQEVVLDRLVAPRKASSGQTISLRMVINSTGPARGRLVLSLNGEPIGLDEREAVVQLHQGKNVKTVSLPVGTRGLHEFQATFVPDGPSQDRLQQNNTAGSITFVAGPGHVRVVAFDERRRTPILTALKDARIDARPWNPGQFPTELHKLVDTNAVVVVDVHNSDFSIVQQEVMRRYVEDLGGGLIMIGGPDSFGAGGWIGSPVAEVLPLDLDPPQKKQMPKGALVLIMHACEVPRGNYWSKQMSIAAIKSLSRLDLVGVVEYAWGAGSADWVYPLSPVGSKAKAIAAVQRMKMGDMPDFGAPMKAGYDALKACKAGQKHMIMISDGDPQAPPRSLLAKLKAARITCTTVAVNPHSPSDVGTMKAIAAATGGRYYFVPNTGINKLPQIFIKEAQIVRRSMIIEETFRPRVTDALSEIVRGVAGGMPSLDGYILTAPKGGLTQVILTSPEADPILAAGQSGLGRCVAFTSSADSQWASAWLGWGGFDRFWEQAVRWAARSDRATDCEIFTDVEGRHVTVTVEAVDKEGQFLQLQNIVGQAIAPDMTARPLRLEQVGPGRYRGRFRVEQSGSHLLNLRYAKAGDEPGRSASVQSVVTLPYAPEFRDLTDNMPLLTKVAEMTGGRVLPNDPAKADLFSHVGLEFPKTATSMMRPLAILWLVLFLLDVAVRRVALNPRAIAARVVAAFRPGRKGAESEQTLSQLRRRRRQVQQEYVQAADGRNDAGRRFAGGETAGEVDLPMADTRPPAEAPSGRTQGEPSGREVKPADHLDRLLKAKRDARRRMQEDERDTES